MKYKVNVVMKIAFLFMTTALAVAMVACQAATPAKTPVTLGGAGLDDMSFPNFVAGTDTAAAKMVTITGSHFKGTNLKYTALSSNKNVATATESGGVVTVTPIDVGTATVTVIAAATADDEVGTEQLDFTVTVTAPDAPPPNNAPTVRTISNLSLVVGDTDTITLSEYFTDPEDDTLTYGAESSDDMIAMVTDPDATSMITITAVAAGRASITVTADDSTNAAASQTFRVTVTEASAPDNNQPYRTAPLPADLTDLKVGVTPDPIDLSNHFSDDEDDELDYAAVPDPDDGTVVTTAVSGSMLTISVVAPGTTTIRVTVSDDANNQVRDSFAVTVVNQAPMIVETEPTRFGPFLPEATQVVRLSRYFSDPEGDSLRYTAVSNMPDKVRVSEVGADSTITITAVAVGTAEIMITANDGTDTAPHTLTVTVMAVPNVMPVVSMEIPNQSLQLVVDEAAMTESATKTLDLGDYFSDEDGLPAALSYSDESDMTTIDGSTLTITASAPGTTTITVTATDGADDVTDMFDVMVTSPATPTATSDIPDQNFAHDDMTVRMVTLSGHFSGATGYSYSMSGDAGVVTVMKAEGVLTLTPGDAGRTVVTVTPSNSGGNGESQSFTVTVAATPMEPVQPVPVPTTSNYLQAQSVPSAGGSVDITLSGYFSGAESYNAGSNNEAILMVSVAGHTLTLAPVPTKHGTAGVTVTPVNSEGVAGSPQTFDVTVQAEPTTKENNEFPDAIKISMIDADGVDADAGGSVDADEITAAKAATKRYELTKYVTDPDGDDTKLKFSAATSNNKNVAVYVTPTVAPTAPTGLDAPADVYLADPTADQLKKMMVEGPDVTIRGLKEGEATITITATDADLRQMTWTIDVTVLAFSNSAPVVQSGITFPGDDVATTATYKDFARLDDERRFKSTDRMPRPLTIDLAELFDDADIDADTAHARTSEDSWKFEAMSTNTNVMAVTMEKIGTRAKPDLHRVVITPTGSGKATIYFKVTDSFGESAGGVTDDDGKFVADNTDNVATSFDVMVNHAPMPEGSQDDPKTLGDAEDEDVAAFRKLLVKDAATSPTLPTLRLVDAGDGGEVEGYFSDEDGDSLLCNLDYRDLPKNVAFEWTSGGSRVEMVLVAVANDVEEAMQRAPGTGYVDVTCYDQVGVTGSEVNFEKATAALTVTVVEGHDLSITR